MSKFMKIILTTLGLIIFSSIIYCVIGLWSFSDMTEKKQIFSLKYNGSYYELYYVFEGALGPDVVQSVIDGKVYSNKTINRGLDNATIDSIIIMDSISIIIIIEEDCFPIHIPLVLKSVPSDSTTATGTPPRSWVNPPGTLLRP